MCLRDGKELQTTKEIEDKNGINQQTKQKASRYANKTNARNRNGAHGRTKNMSS
jgi:hypothetical protein